MVAADDLNKKIFENELLTMKVMTKHECCIRLIEHLTTDTNSYIVTEYLEGPLLDDFCKSHKNMSEKFMKNFIKKIAPALTDLQENGIVLDFISTKSFYFKYYKNDSDFQIKFFDFGASILYTDINIQRNYMLIESRKGAIASQKTNVLSMGMIIYKLLFGDTIYNFSQHEDPRNTISNSKNYNLY